MSSISLSKLLSHPIFWSPSEILNFLKTVSDLLIPANRAKYRAVLEKLEANFCSVVIEKNSWLLALSEDVRVHLHKYPKTKYNGKRLVDLIRAIRNLKDHYDELPLPIQQSLGEFPSGYLQYWLSTFPNLIIVLYKIAKPPGLSTVSLKQYYKNRNWGSFNLETRLNCLSQDIDCYTRSGGLISKFEVTCCHNGSLAKSITFLRRPPGISVQTVQHEMIIKILINNGEVEVSRWNYENRTSGSLKLCLPATKELRHVILLTDSVDRAISELKTGKDSIMVFSSQDWHSIRESMRLNYHVNDIKEIPIKWTHFSRKFRGKLLKREVMFQGVAVELLTVCPNHQVFNRMRGEFLQNLVEGRKPIVLEDNAPPLMTMRQPREIVTRRIFAIEPLIKFADQAGDCFYIHNITPDEFYKLVSHSANLTNFRRLEYKEEFDKVHWDPQVRASHLMEFIGDRKLRWVKSIGFCMLRVAIKSDLKEGRNSVISEDAFVTSVEETGDKVVIVSEYNDNSPKSTLIPLIVDQLLSKHRTTRVVRSISVPELISHLNAINNSYAELDKKTLFKTIVTSMTKCEVSQMIIYQKMLNQRLARSKDFECELVLDGYSEIKTRHPYTTPLFNPPLLDLSQREQILSLLKMPSSKIRVWYSYKTGGHFDYGLDDLEPILSTLGYSILPPQQSVVAVKEYSLLKQKQIAGITRNSFLLKKYHWLCQRSASEWEFMDVFENSRIGSLLFKLNQTKNINMVDEVGNTILHSLRQTMHPRKISLDEYHEFLEYLVGHGFDVNQVNHKNESILHSAIEALKDVPPKTLELLGSYGFDFKSKALDNILVDAIMRTGSPNLLKNLSELGYKLPANKKDIFVHCLVSLGWIDCVKYFVGKLNFDMHSKSAQGKTLLHSAFENWSSPAESQCAMVNYLLESGLDPNATDVSGSTPLIYALKKGSMILLETIKALEQYGFKVTKQVATQGLVAIFSRDRFSFIHPDNRVLEYFKSVGPDFDITLPETQETLLHLACEICWLGGVEWLVEKCGFGTPSKLDLTNAKNQTAIEQLYTSSALPGYLHGKHVVGKYLEGKGAAVSSLVQKGMGKKCVCWTCSLKNGNDF